MAAMLANTIARPTFAGRVSSTSNGSKTRMAGSSGSWLPGSQTPAYLNTLPA